MKTNFLFLICLLIFCSCNSYLSVEKRKYIDGFYVEQNFFQHLKVEKDTQRNYNYPCIHLQGRNSDSSSRSDFFAYLAGDDEQVKNSIIKNNVTPLKKIVFHKDTLKKKNRKNLPRKFDERKDISQSDNTYNFFAATGFAFSIISYAFLAYGLVFALFIPSIIISFAGFIFCIAGLIQIKNKTKMTTKSAGMAKFGLIATSILLGLFLVYVLL